jgi:hypothetical protein
MSLCHIILWLLLLSFVKECEVKVITRKHFNAVCAPLQTGEKIYSEVVRMGKQPVISQGKNKWNISTCLKDHNSSVSCEAAVNGETATSICDRRA